MSTLGAYGGAVKSSASHTPGALRGRVDSRRIDPNEHSPGSPGGEVATALGIETGPGALLTGAVGGAIEGFVGFFSVNRTASWIEH